MRLRWTIAGLLAVLLLVATGYYTRATAGISALNAFGRTNLLGAPATPTRSSRVPDIAAIEGNPLNQSAVAGVLSVRAAKARDKAQPLRDAEVLGHLGWRSTSALQNLLWRNATNRDLPGTLNTLDALLRREQMLEQIYPILNLMALDPMFRQHLVERLATRPPWRGYYFLSASDLSRPQDIESRYNVMRAVQRSGDRMTRNEIAPLLPKLIEGGHSDRAAALWRPHQRSDDMPLADRGFATIAAPRTSGTLPIPFEWRLESGSGYFADAGRDERGNFISIDWNGRGTPLFVSQLTSAPPARYRLSVTSDTPGADLLKRIVFQLSCPGKPSVVFAPLSRSSGNTLQLASGSVVPCAYPKLELVGSIQPTAGSGTVVLRAMQLERIG